MSFADAIARVLPREGGYSNNKADSGGETMWGITEGVARANGYAGPMRDMPLIAAQVIYRRQYWDTLDLSNCPSGAVAEELFDTGINCGVGVAAEFLQRSLNALNRRQRDYADLVVDSVLGPMTWAAFNGFLRERGVEGVPVMLKALNCLQGQRYIRLAEQREKDEEFVYGWLNRRIGL